MGVDKNLFLYDLAVVAIMKNEEPYVKEWLDYHLLAGVDHFFIYDNDSTEDFKKILQPYIDAELVTYIFYPGKARQYEAYNAAVRDYKFYCRYMAFVDGDEFILSKSKPTITEVVEEILTPNPNAAALGVNWIFYGSNHQDTADYSKGVIERFTLREESVNKHIKTIANPRKINYFCNPHFSIYFSSCFSVNEQGENFDGAFNEYASDEKIVINHYYMKSREEYLKKVQRGVADFKVNVYDEKNFSHETQNDVFDDGILKYRDERRKALAKMGGVWMSFQPLQNLNRLTSINFYRHYHRICWQDS